MHYVSFSERRSTLQHKVSLVKTIKCNEPPNQHFFFFLLINCIYKLWLCFCTNFDTLVGLPKIVSFFKLRSTITKYISSNT